MLVNKALAYFALAIALGLLATLVPLAAFAGLRGGNGVFKTDSLPKGFRGLEGSYTLKTGVSGSEVDVLIVSFLVASIVYLLFRRRIPERERRWARIP
jgi:hypothetical protein